MERRTKARFDKDQKKQDTNPAPTKKVKKANTKVLRTVVNETYPNDYLEVRTGRIWCNPCFRYFTSKTIHPHINSTTMHQAAVNKYERETKQQGKLNFAIATAKKAGGISENVSDENSEFRFRICKMFMENAIPMSRVDNMRDELESIAQLKLTHSSNLAKEMIPMVRAAELTTLRTELRTPSDTTMTSLFEASPTMVLF